MINRLKAALTRLGIRGFNQSCGKPRGVSRACLARREAIPPNMLREMNNELARLAFVRAQMKATEKARLEHIKEAPKAGEPMV